MYLRLPDNPQAPHIGRLSRHRPWRLETWGARRLSPRAPAMRGHRP